MSLVAKTRIASRTSSVNAMVLSGIDRGTASVAAMVPLQQRIRLCRKSGGIQRGNIFPPPLAQQAAGGGSRSARDGGGLNPLTEVPPPLPPLFAGVAPPPPP